ncbi:hypothetical protein E2C01_080190 [Portunus trituberculatus]|uniref:Uncharacterized protein n=1 Tax=Portunus trituberculatus TaxID=210409 RepID=A0A5B7IXR9_PORTR|nr:hypothetical protein [Portunus trituberculatus]
MRYYLQSHQPPLHHHTAGDLQRREQPYVGVHPVSVPLPGCTPARPPVHLLRSNSPSLAQ